jgi:hypothetical protein
MRASAVGDVEPADRAADIALGEPFGAAGRSSDAPRGNLDRRRAFRSDATDHKVD